MKTGRIKKARVQSDYTVVLNKVIQDKTLSMKAKGMYSYLLSLPVDWEIYKTELHNHFKDGRDACINAFDELIEYGVVLVDPKRNDKGQLKGFDYYVRPIPENPKPDNPNSEKPKPENPELQSKHLTKEISNKVNIEEDPEINLILNSEKKELLFEFIDWRKKMKFPKWHPDTVRKHARKFSQITEAQIVYLIDYTQSGQYRTLFYDRLKKMMKTVDVVIEPTKKEFRGKL